MQQLPYVGKLIALNCTVLSIRAGPYSAVASMSCALLSSQRIAGLLAKPPVPVAQAASVVQEAMAAKTEILSERRLLLGLTNCHASAPNALGFRTGATRQGASRIRAALGSQDRTDPFVQRSG